MCMFRTVIPLVCTIIFYPNFIIAFWGNALHFLQLLRWHLTFLYLCYKIKYLRIVYVYTVIFKFEKNFILTYLVTSLIVIPAKPYFHEPGCTIHADILYRTCTCYNCFPEDEPSGSKYIHVEDEWKIKLNLTEVHFVGLHYTIISQCAVQIT